MENFTLDENVLKSTASEFTLVLNTDYYTWRKPDRTVILTNITAHKRRHNLKQWKTDEFLKLLTAFTAADLAVVC